MLPFLLQVNRTFSEDISPVGKDDFKGCICRHKGRTKVNFAKVAKRSSRKIIENANCENKLLQGINMIQKIILQATIKVLGD